MGVFTRPDSRYYYLRLEGYTDARGNKLREKTKIRSDADTPQQRKANRALAEQLYHARMTELARTDHELPEKRPRITLNAYLDTWYVPHALPTHRGAERERSALPHLRAAFGERTLEQIDRAAVSAWITKRLTTGHVIAAGPRTKARTLPPPSPSTVNREIDVLKGILQSAVPKYLAASPLYGMKRLHAPTPKRRLMSEDEERRLLAVLSPEDRAFVLVGLDALARLSDILDLKATDDHGDRLWIADPKTGGGFEVPISTRLRKALDALPEDGREYLFPSRRVAKTERDRRNGVRQMLERACAQADPPIPYGRAAGGLTFHWATRRTGATRMLSRNVPVATVQKVGRWQDPGVVLGIYHELIDDDARQAVEAVGPPTRRARSGPRARPNRTTGDP